MKITVRQLKQLIKEQVEEAKSDTKYDLNNVPAFRRMTIEELGEILAELDPDMRVYTALSLIASGKHPRSPRRW